MKKVRLMGLAVVFAIMMTNTGCGNSKENQAAIAGQNVTETKELEENQTGAESKDASESSKELKMLACNSNVGNIVSAEDGMYRIVHEELADKTWAYKIYYIDYKSAQEIVLCNESSCNHDTDKCIGVIEDINLFSPQLFVYNDKLYVFSSCDESDSVSMITGDMDAFEEETRQACLYEMNLDGTERKCISNFPEDASIDENVFGWNGQLIFCQKKVEKEKTKEGYVQNVCVDRKMLALDTKNETFKELQDFSAEFSICGIYKNNIVCQKIIYPKGYNNENTLNMDYDEWVEIMNKSDSTYLLYDMETGKEKELCTLSQERYFNDSMVFEDKLYISDDSDKMLCIDLNNGSKSEIVVKKGKSISLVTNLGDSILCWEKGDSKKTYLWKPAENKLIEFDMVLKGTNLNADILTYNSKYIVVACDGDVTKNSDGSYEIHSQKYGIVEKEKLYQGNNEYNPVDMCSNGLNE